MTVFLFCSHFFHYKEMQRECFWYHAFYVYISPNTRTSELIDSYEMLYEDHAARRPKTFVIYFLLVL